MSYKYLGRRGKAHFWQNEAGKILWNLNGRRNEDDEPMDTIMFYRPEKGHPQPPEAAK